MADMTCPKCRGAMRSYERNNVTVDQCEDCRGLFLDRGELERLTAAESTWFDRSSVPPPPSTSSAYRDSPGYSSESRPHKKPKSFFDELFG